MDICPSVSSTSSAGDSSRCSMSASNWNWYTAIIADCFQKDRNDFGKSGEYNMEKILSTITNSIKRNALPVEYHFDGPISEEEFIVHIAFLTISDWFADNAERYSWRELVERFTGQDTYQYDSVYRTKDLQKQRVLNRTVADRERLHVSEDSHDPYLDLMKEGASLQKRGRFYGKKYSELDYIQINYIEGDNALYIVKLFKDKRILKPNTTSANVFSAYNDYSNLLKSLNKVEDPKLWILQLINIAKLEGNIPVYLIYRLAKMVEEKSLQEIPQEIRLLYDVVCISPSGPCVQSRFIDKRHLMIASFLDPSKKEWIYSHIIKLLIIQAFVRNDLRKSEIINQQISSVSPAKLKTYFQEHYNLLRTFQLDSNDRQGFSKPFVRAIKDCYRILFIDE